MATGALIVFIMGYVVIKRETSPDTFGDSRLNKLQVNWQGLGVVAKMHRKRLKNLCIIVRPADQPTHTVKNG